MKGDQNRHDFARMHPAQAPTVLAGSGDGAALLGGERMPTPEDLAQLITDALTQGRRAPAKATRGAPISADSESGTLIARMRVIDHLDQLDDVTWKWARAWMVTNRLEYAYQQPMLSRDPVRGHLYDTYPERDYLRLAAFGLLTTVGLTLLPDWAAPSDFPPHLDLAAWRAGHCSLALRRWAEPSRLYLPNGQHPLRHMLGVEFRYAGVSDQSVSCAAVLTDIR